MGSIRTRKLDSGSTTFEAQVRLKGHRQITKTFRRKTDARNWIQSTETKLKSGESVTSAAQRRTVEEMLSRFKRDALHRADAKLAARQLDWWIEQLGYLYLSDLTADRIARYLF